MNVCRHMSSFIANTRTRLLRMPLYQSALPLPLSTDCFPSFVRVFCLKAGVSQSGICSKPKTAYTGLSRLHLASRNQQLQHLSPCRLNTADRLQNENTSLTVNNILSRPSVGIRWYSSDPDDKEKSKDPNANTELKGVVVHVPSPLMWLKNKWYTYCIRTAIDSSFNLDEFVFGAKQALSFLTRLIVQKDYDMLKSVATQEAVDTVMQLVMPWSAEQQQSIEVLVDDITLAAASVTSLDKRGPNAYHVNVDMLCIAVKRHKSRPMLIQMTVRFKREYSGVTATDWMIADIREFTVRELTVQSNQQPK
jgi:hypothetical protein